MSCYCYYCGGAGEVVVCPDDMCRGSDECMHGDGMGTCPVCDGDPYFGDEEEFDLAVREAGEGKKAEP